jgi:hypothetical protein
MKLLIAPMHGSVEKILLLNIHVAKLLIIKDRSI